MIGYYPIFSAISPINLSSLLVAIVHFDILFLFRAESKEWVNLIMVNYEYYNTNKSNEMLPQCLVFILKHLYFFLKLTITVVNILHILWACFVHL